MIVTLSKDWTNPDGKILKKGTRFEVTADLAKELKNAGYTGAPSAAHTDKGKKKKPTAKAKGE